jgi:hypothetical protein
MFVGGSMLKVSESLMIVNSGRKQGLEMDWVVKDTLREVGRSLINQLKLDEFSRV